MNKIKLVCFASILAAGITHASSTPCDGFEIKIKNDLPDNLLVTKIQVNGAEIQPGGIQQISGKSAEIFTVNKTADDRNMAGEFVFHTLNLPSKEVKIQFDLKNKTLFCEHSDKTKDGDYSI